MTPPRWITKNVVRDTGVPYELPENIHIGVLGPTATASIGISFDRGRSVLAFTEDEAENLIAAIREAVTEWRDLAEKNADQQTAAKDALERVRKHANDRPTTDRDDAIVDALALGAYLGDVGMAAGTTDTRVRQVWKQRTGQPLP